LIEFERFRGELRSVYRQLDGAPILAAFCTCDKDPLTCPVDAHAIKSRQDAVITSGKMRAVIYARVSTSKKAEKQDPEMQLAEMRAYIPRRRWTLAHELVDHVTGSKDRRPALDRLWNLCRRRQVDVVIVYRFDRFARSARQLIDALEEFRVLGIQFVSLHENVDTTTAAGTLMFQIIAAFAEFERSIIAERVRSGIAHVRAEGATWGRPRLILDMARIGRRRRQGASWATIAREMGTSRASVQRAHQGALKP
jgi:DNA invertase Pin-like site-specific DNA recombinase